MTQARYIIGPVLKVLESLPEASADLVLTSPPFLNLRSYLPDDHPDKDQEIGLADTPGEFIDSLLDVVEAAARVLAPHGSMVIELGDTYSGSGGAGGDYNDGGMRDGQPRFDGTAKRARSGEHCVSKQRFRTVPERRTDRPNGCDTHTQPAQLTPMTGGDGWPLDKSLCLIPEIFRFSLVYGFNPLTGRCTPRWRARNVIRHFRPNPSVGALGDKVRPATSEWVVVCQDRRRYFDLDAVRKPNERVSERYVGRRRSHQGDMNRPDEGASPQNEAGAPPLDWWDDDDLKWRDAAGFIEATFPYPGAHFATFSPRVVARLIEPMCPLKVCRVCGKPSERITEVDYDPHGERRDEPKGGSRGTDSDKLTQREQNAQAMEHGRADKLVRTVGWTDCGHGGDWRNGVVLDPFAGSGTTLQVATGHGRDAIGIDINEANAELALERVGPLFLTVEHHNQLEVQP